MNKEKAIKEIVNVRTSLGIEIGSTRIKAVLVDSNFQTLATGSYDWENKLENGYWTYSLEQIWEGLQTSYARLSVDVEKKYGLTLKKVGSIGISAMMHGYLPFDKSGRLLTPFRTWRNVTTTEAAAKLSELFQTNIPERWSIAHLYQAILDDEAHVKEIDYLTTLAGYIHWRLTKQKFLGIGDASGMFPIDSMTKDYDSDLIAKFDRLNVFSSLKEKLPRVLPAGEEAGYLTIEGAKLLDPKGNLKAGILLCPPEGDAGTGMVATNSVEKLTGNISVGTSAFAMIVLEKNLSKIYPEIDLVTTPDGSPVAMVHTNNCSSDLNAWIRLFAEFAEISGQEISRDQIFSLLFKKSLEADEDFGKLMSYGYLSGENITKLPEGRPLFVRQADSHLSLANFMKTHIASAFAAIRLGMDILETEGIVLQRLVAHGGLFKTPEVGQAILSSALRMPITIMETAGEGGAWGIAILAAFVTSKEKELSPFLNNQVFAQAESLTLEASPEEKNSYDRFMSRYVTGLDVERKAVECLEGE
jgi:sugar (pentulose or hexulose) kinase